MSTRGLRGASLRRRAFAPLTYPRGANRDFSQDIATGNRISPASQPRFVTSSAPPNISLASFRSRSGERRRRVESRRPREAIAAATAP
ncbi:Hypothetical protein BN69_1220 [Methylocystis sp. SC2]|nr:Hypothetical protein BN69_1220 [Methylocystis sp. SC2]